jgi:hypothetical protein
MILELLEYLMSSCSKTGRSMGFISASLKVRARFRRCGKAWAPHIGQTRHVILEAAGRCRGRRKVVLLGAGLLHDIPLKELSGLFDEVVLVDIVHHWLSRISARRFRNVKQISADITGVMEHLRRVAGIPDAAMPVSRPTLFLDDPRLDLTVSVNLLSQLPDVPGKYLEGLRDEHAISVFQKHLVEAHLDYLCRLPGHTALITDTAVRYVARDGSREEEWDPLHGVKLPPPEFTWEWRLAPSPEIGRGIDMFTTVAAYADWKQAAALPGRTPDRPTA